MTIVSDWLATAAAWRFASLLFQPPTQEALIEMRALVAELSESGREEARQLAAVPFEAWEGEFHRVLGPAGCPASESAYDDNALAGRGPLLARVAAFYEAFAYRPDGDPREVPDHVSVELGFLGYLALKIAFAEHAGESEAREVAHDAYARFLDEHPAHWFGRFIERLVTGDSKWYALAAGWLAARWGRKGREPDEPSLHQSTLIRRG
jgi:TorA maturation chaperone TorD